MEIGKVKTEIQAIALGKVKIEIRATALSKVNAIALSLTTTDNKVLAEVGQGIMRLKGKVSKEI